MKKTTIFILCLVMICSTQAMEKPTYYYTILNIDENATTKEVMDAFWSKSSQKLSKGYMNELREAYEILSNVEARQVYDQQGSYSALKFLELQKKRNRLLQMCQRENAIKMIDLDLSYNAPCYAKRKFESNSLNDDLKEQQNRSIQIISDQTVLLNCNGNKRPLRIVHQKVLNSPKRLKTEEQDEVKPIQVNQYVSEIEEKNNLVKGYLAQYEVIDFKPSFDDIYKFISEIYKDIATYFEHITDVNHYSELREGFVNNCYNVLGSCDCKADSEMENYTELINKIIDSVPFKKKELD